MKAAAAGGGAGGAGGGEGGAGRRRANSAALPLSSSNPRAAQAAQRSSLASEQLQHAQPPTPPQTTPRRRSMPTTPTGSSKQASSDSRLDVSKRRLESFHNIEVGAHVEVLDLSFNDLMDDCLAALARCELLQQAYFAGNLITSLESLPSLPSLEFLSVSHNQLTNLKLSAQPSLQGLSVANNRIASFADFPAQAQLVTLLVAGNECMSSPKARVAAVLLGGPNLMKLDGTEVLDEERKAAESLPMQLESCLQSGWLLPDYGVEDAVAQHWLTLQQLPEGFSLRSCRVSSAKEGEPCSCSVDISPPTAYDPRKAVRLGFTWYRAVNRYATFELIPQAEQQVYTPCDRDVGMLLKCQITLLDHMHAPTSICTKPVQPGDGRPKVAQLRIEGPLVEGQTVTGIANVAWCGSQPGPLQCRWFRLPRHMGPVPVGEGTTYRAQLADVGCSLVFQCTPYTQSGTAGVAKDLATGPVAAGPPSVSEVGLEGECSSGCVLTGTGTYSGGMEGTSVFSWHRAPASSQEFAVIPGACLRQYTLSDVDIGATIKFTYTPVSSEGAVGTAQSFKTPTINAAAPQIVNLEIEGDLVEGGVVRAKGVYMGGREGNSTVQWYHCASLAQLQTMAPDKNNCRGARIPAAAIGHHIAVKYVPVRADGIAGKAVLAKSSATVTAAPPQAINIAVAGEMVEGSTLTASYTYVGGAEGASTYGWSRRKQGVVIPPESIPEAQGRFAYTLQLQDVGRFVSFHCIPRRSDGVEGPSSSSQSTATVAAVLDLSSGLPTVRAVTVAGAAVEGQTLTVVGSYWGGREGFSRYQWRRVVQDGRPEPVPAATNSCHELTAQDVGCTMAVTYTPVRDDDVAGQPVTSNCTSVVQAAPMEQTHQPVSSNGRHAEIQQSGVHDEAEQQSRKDSTHFSSTEVACHEDRGQDAARTGKHSHAANATDTGQADPLDGLERPLSNGQVGADDRQADVISANGEDPISPHK
eukprot:jgi/Chlat1/484/Chrsp103S00982